MIVPANFLSPDALSGLIEEFVTRDGTDYGETEVSMQERVDQVRAQIERGEALILFDSTTETTTIIAAADLAKIQAENQQSE
jgi:uncharacterized protein YheU (UPF0270 family)